MIFIVKSQLIAVYNEPSLILHLAAWQSFTQGMLKNKTTEKNIQPHHVMRTAVYTDTY